MISAFKSKVFDKISKNPLGCSFGCKNLLNSTCLTMKFHDCHHLVSISEVALELELRSEAPSTASSAQQAPKKNPDRHVPKTYPFRSLHFDVNMHVPFLPLTVQTFCAPISNAKIMKEKIACKIKHVSFYNIL